jgi:hypothetical protein
MPSFVIAYHVSTLLQVSAFAKQDQNQSLSADLCERALFAFGRVTTSAFRRDLEAGAARLDFRRPENRQFWLAGYHYIRTLIRKGTFRTALEWAKVLFSLDPVRDPYGMNHWIHVFAIKAHEPKWLEDYLEYVSQGQLRDESMYYRNTLALAKLQQGDVDGARDFLVKQMESMPWLYCSLFQALGLDAPPSIWGVTAEGEGDTFYTELYVYSTKDLWKNPRAMTVLQETAKVARKNSDGSIGINPLLELRTARFIFLDGTTGLLSMVPTAYIDTHPNYESDPLPPRREDNIFSTRGTKLPWEDDERDTQHIAIRNLLREAQVGVRPGQADVREFDGNDGDNTGGDEANVAPFGANDQTFVAELLQRLTDDGIDDEAAAGGMFQSIFDAVMGLIVPVRENDAAIVYEQEDIDAETPINTRAAVFEPPGAWPGAWQSEEDGEGENGDRERDQEEES